MENSNDLNDTINKKDKRILFFILFLPCLLVKRTLDNDTWFLLNSGRYVMDHGIPYTEPFSMHENMDFVLQQWLTDVVFWNIYDFFGENGLFLLVMICYAIIIFLMYKLTMKVSDDNFFISFITTFMSSILIYTYMVTRPTIFTLIIVLVELNALERFVLTGKNKYLLVLPILSLVMINLHAALWPMLFVLLLPYMVSSFKLNIGIIKNDGFEKKYFFLTIALMILVGFINPYGLDAMTYLLRSAGNSNMQIINEIQPPYVNSPTGAMIYIYICLIALVYIRYRKGETTLRYFFLTLGTTYMALTSIRNITYFGICAVFPLAYYLKDFDINKIALTHRLASARDKSNRLRVVLVGLILVVLAIGVYNKSIKNSTYTEYLDLNHTIDFIYDNEDTSKVVLYTGFNDGSLAQFRGLPSYIDPRAEVYFKKHNHKADIFDEYVKLVDGKIYYKDVLDKYGFTHLIVPRGSLLSTYLKKDSEYASVYKNDKYFLFKKIKQETSQ